MTSEPCYPVFSFVPFQRNIAVFSTSLDQFCNVIVARYRVRGDSVTGVPVKKSRARPFLMQIPKLYLELAAGLTLEV